MALDGAIVSKRPYRFFRHPNYVVEMGEIAAPTRFCQFTHFCSPSPIAIIVTIRVKAENAALAGLSHAEPA
ncbi:isoprenylcysteine carboxylmethyltransferase family protein [Rhizobium mongolense]|uniref:isoprenylcysteine carboxylmethyltransferase family protein n=1 Tax=Rhizobium mongolense TaxID=57676 RepID=UPI000AE2D1E5